MVLENHPFNITENDHLEIGGMDSLKLASKYGTPLYVYDVSIIRENCRAFVDTFKELGVKAHVAYASKAFSSIAMLQVMKQENLSLDVVSEGELYTALQADFPVHKIHMHGNNKSRAELSMAIENRIGCIVVDNFYEIELLSSLLEEHQTEMDVLMRVTPGIETKTHQYIMTGNVDSKFGFNLHNGHADQAFLQLMQNNRIRFKGLHCHLGSQVFETDGFKLAAELLFTKLKSWKEKHDFAPDVLNPGGGFGIRYTGEDKPLPYPIYVKELVETVQKLANSLDIPLPEIWIEPGRSIAGNAGVTLYTIGSIKEIPDVRKYISVDGGLTDNLRPALYQAKYEGILANKADSPALNEVSVAGKCCESGDMLIWDLPLPPVDSGDPLHSYLLL